MTDLVPPIARASFPPGRSAACFCNSGKRFKACCGKTSQPRTLPAGIGIVPDFLDTATCDRIRQFAQASSAKRLEVVDPERSTVDKVVRIFDERRVTERVDISERQDEVDGWVQDALAEHIKPIFGREFAWFEQPQMLKYTPGGLYRGHADSDNYHPQEGCWKKVLDRDVSLLIYLNNDYEGGSLYFEHFDFTIQPRAGMLVFFPSDSRYKHEARSVTAGLRFALVSWAAFKDEPRVRTEPPEHAVRM